MILYVVSKMGGLKPDILTLLHIFNTMIDEKKSGGKCEHLRSFGHQSRINFGSKMQPVLRV